MFLPFTPFNTFTNKSHTVILWLTLLFCNLEVHGLIFGSQDGQPNKYIRTSLSPTQQMIG